MSKMKSTWINKKKNNRLILFFNGWGMDEKAVSNLDCENNDVCMFSNYDSSIVNFASDFSEYEDINIVAWSLGILAAEFFMNNNTKKITKSIAISGTSYPAHDDYGIPVQIFNGTIANLSVESLKKFQRRTCGSKENYERNQHIFNQKNIDDKKKELETILKLQTFLPTEKNTWTQAIICTGDLIFPVKNLENYWSSRLTPVYIESPHYPFNKWKSWEEVLESVASTPLRHRKSQPLTISLKPKKYK
ncbi:MAG: hypothetical protein A2491_12680 [Bacteroidetes bacterium RIFOXYC12_FULL_35_7]|nr:MAG: hypothetical protein A2491_12680 [Bacteroidetes bacterium RIFOXYC12_FULL_35_7]